MKWLVTVLFLLVSLSVFSEEPENTQSLLTPKDEVEQAFKRKYVLLFPLIEYSPNADEALRQEVMNNIASVSSKLSRFKLLQETQFLNEVYSGDKIEASKIKRAGLIREAKKLGVDEILLITSVSFSQIGVKPEKEEEDDNRSFLEEIFYSIFLAIFFGSDEGESNAQYSNNIETQLGVNITRLNLINGDVTDNIYLNSMFTGGSRVESKNKAMALFNENLTKEILALYPIGGVSYRENKDYVLLNKGYIDGIKPGSLFNIVRHDEVIIIDGDEMASPGQRVAIAQATDITESSSRLKIIRQWGNIGDTSKTKENQNFVYSLNLTTSKNIDNAGFKVGADVMFKPFSTFDFGFGLKYLRAVDSRNDITQGPSIDIITALHFFDSSLLSMSLQSGVNLNLLFRSDDADNTVSGVIVGVPIFLNLEHKLNRNWNAFFALGYLFSNKNPEWNIDKDTGKKDGDGNAITETIPGAWNGSAPKVDVSGAYIKLGMKRYIF